VFSSAQWFATQEGVAPFLEENYMIIAGLIASVCLGFSGIGYFLWRDSKIG
jgi:hypothetical protein